EERAIGAARGRRARGSHGRTLPSWPRDMHHVFAAAFAAILGFVYEVRAAGAEAALLHDDVDGRSIDTVDVGGVATRFEELENARAPGLVTLRFRAHGDAVLVPHCAGRERVVVGETTYPELKGPFVAPLADREQDVRIDVRVSPYEKRIACAEPPREGR